MISSPLLGLSSLLFLLATPYLVHADRHYEIFNNCGLSLNLYINGVLQGPLSSGATVTRDFPDNWSGFIYTDLNQGNPNGAGTVRAGFYGPNSQYYIVRDPQWFNVGVSIRPIDKNPKQGYCITPECLYQSCPANIAFESPPTAFPPATPPAPPQPYYQCTADNAYRVTFCPDGQIPNYQSRPYIISPKKSSSKCLDVRGYTLANGTPVQVYDCNGTPAQFWAMRRAGGTQIRLSGTDFCLDAGSTPANGVGMKIWQCYDNLPAQTWVYGIDKTLRLGNTNYCLDLTDGDLTNGRRTQIWNCGQVQNDNQIWNL